MLRTIALLLCLACTLPAAAQSFPLSRDVATDEARLAAAMPALVAQVDAAYRDEDAERERIHRMRLRIAAGDHAGAIEQIHALRRLRQDKGVAGADTALLAYETFSAAKLAEAEGTPAADALRDAFRAHYGTLDDRSAHRLKPMFLADLPRAQADLRKAAAPAIEHGRLDLPQALELVRWHAFVQVFSAFS